MWQILAYKGEGELCNLSSNFHAEWSSEAIHQLIDLIFWVFCSAIRSPLSYEIGNWTI